MLKTNGRVALFVLVCVMFGTSLNLLSAESACGDQAIAPLTAIQHGVQYFDGLISKGKLDPSWRASIHSITISLRNIKGFAEYVVSFQSKEGGKSPVSVYLNMTGQYTGSNLEP